MRRVTVSKSVDVAPAQSYGYTLGDEGVPALSFTFRDKSGNGQVVGLTLDDAEAFANEVLAMVEAGRAWTA